MGALAQNRPANSGRVYTCKIGQLLAAGDEEDRATVAEEMANDDLSNRVIGRWLGVSEGTVVKHRLQGCACFRG